MHKTLAQLRNPVLPEKIGGGAAPDYQKGGAGLGGLITGLLGALLIAGFLLAFITFILGAIDWITSAGDKTKLESARNRITSALVGLVVVGASWAIMTVIAQFFNLDLEHLPIPAIPNVGNVP